MLVATGISRGAEIPQRDTEGKCSRGWESPCHPKYPGQPKVVGDAAPGPPWSSWRGSPPTARLDPAPLHCHRHLPPAWLPPRSVSVPCRGHYRGQCRGLRAGAPAEGPAEAAVGRWRGGVRRFPPDPTPGPIFLASPRGTFPALHFPLGTLITGVIRKTIIPAEWEQLNLFLRAFGRFHPTPSHRCRRDAGDPPAAQPSARSPALLGCGPRREA